MAIDSHVSHRLAGHVQAQVDHMVLDVCAVPLEGAVRVFVSAALANHPVPVFVPLAYYGRYKKQMWVLQ